MNTENFWPLFSLWTLGLVVASNLLAAWFLSNFPQHLWNAVHRLDEVFTKDDLTDAAVSRYGKWGDLWVCPLCLGTWISGGVALVVAMLAELPFATVAKFTGVGMTTWPVCFYLLYGILKRV